MLVNKKIINNFFFRLIKNLGFGDYLFAMVRFQRTVSGTQDAYDFTVFRFDMMDIGPMSPTNQPISMSSFSGTYKTEKTRSATGRNRRKEVREFEER